MSHSILYDCRAIKLHNDEYILLLQIGDSRTWETVNGRSVREKHWCSLQLVDDAKGEIFCSSDKMKERIKSVSEGYESVAKKSCSNFFKTEKSMRIFLENGLKKAFSFEEYRSAGNCFNVQYWDKQEKRIGQKYVRDEEEMRTAIKELLPNPNIESISLGTYSRDLTPVITKEQPQHGYLIRYDDDDGLQPYFKQKTKTRFIFTYSLANARLFRTLGNAQRCKNTLLALKPDAKFSVVEYGTPEAAKSEMVAE